ncbi:MAG TPA: hypothetical protein VIM30_12755 [Candidatus Limnocylindrales bacterium]
MARPRARLGWLAVAVGVAWMAIAHATGPRIAMPLFDGVVVEDPYRFLTPPPGGAGDPTSYSATSRLEGGQTPQIVAGTTEQPPQAQLIASQAAFQVSPGTSSITVSITAAPPPAVPASGHIAGNVYEIKVANQTGVALTVLQSTPVTVVLRAPAGEGNGMIARSTNGTWSAVQTEAAGLQFMYVANVTALGDFAVISPGPGAGASASASVGSSLGGSLVPTASVVPVVPAPSQQPNLLSDPRILLGGVAAIVVVAALIGLALRSGAEQERRTRRAPGWGDSKRRRRR